VSTKNPPKENNAKATPISGSALLIKSSVIKTWWFLFREKIATLLYKYFKQGFSLESKVKIVKR